jgi:type VI secretion system protein ImpJ
MSLNNRVVWSEGLFLRPQHFQQAERYLEWLLRHSVEAQQPYAWGVLGLQIDPEALKLGRLGLVSASGVFPDGTPFSVPHEVGIPEPLAVRDDCRDAVVSLALPLRRPGMAEIALERSAEHPLVRYIAVEQQARDNVAELDSMADMKIGELNLRLQLRSELSPAYAALDIARVIEKRSDGRVVLDEEFVPPCLDSHANARLGGYVREIHGLLRQRAQVLAERVSQPGSKGVAEFADFLLLQLCNRMEPVYAHLAECRPLHPELLYRHCLALAGELTTFGRRDRRCPAFPPYRQDAPGPSFAPVIEEVRRALTAVLEQTAIAIALQDKGRGVYAGQIPEVGLIRGATFVLAANADVPAERLRVQFPTQLKIGPPEKIRDLVVSHLPGIVVRPLPVAPRQIPYHAGYSYFELDRASEFWKSLEVSRVIAMHVAGEFPGLNLQLWAIRD